MWRFVSTSRFAQTVRQGLTLLELIVSLAILAVLSTIAVQALDPLADQSRWEASRKGLEELRQATLGRLSQVDGQPLVSGLVADTGALPSSLDDFLALPAGLISHQSQAFDSDRDSINDVALSSGWRGPYLLLGPGHSTVLDGWGNAPLIDPDGGVFDFVSAGADGDSLLPEDGYAADLKVELPTNSYQANVVFRLFEIDGLLGSRIDPTPTGSEQLGVLVYRVNGTGGTTGAIQEQLIPVAAVGTFEASLAGIVHGRIAARGVLWNDVDTDQLFDVGETLVLSSFIHYLTVVGGVDHRVELDLR